jgi:FkbM family methyltransferase
MIKTIAHSTLKYYIRRFPVSKGKGRILSLLWKPLSFDHYKRQAVLRHAPIRMNCDLTKLIQRHLYFYGSYEEEYCLYWMALASHAQTIFDIGANVGLYSLLAAVKNPDASIYAFEPTREMVDALTENVRLNGIQNIWINPIGVGKISGEAFLHCCTGSDGSNEGMNFVTGEMAQDSDVTVPLTSIDDFCRQKQINRIDLMKMDIEGGEYDALLGAENLLRTQAIGCIFVELAEWAANRSGHSTVEIKRILLDAEYSIYKLGRAGLATVQPEEIHGGDNVIAFAHEPGFINPQQLARP